MFGYSRPQKPQSGDSDEDVSAMTTMKTMYDNYDGSDDDDDDDDSRILPSPESPLLSTNPMLIPKLLWLDNSMEDNSKEKFGWSKAITAKTFGLKEGIKRISEES